MTVSVYEMLDRGQDDRSLLHGAYNLKFDTRETNRGRREGNGERDEETGEEYALISGTLA